MDSDSCHCQHYQLYNTRAMTGAAPVPDPPPSLQDEDHVCILQSLVNFRLASGAIHEVSLGPNWITVSALHLREMLEHLY